MDLKRRLFRLSIFINVVIMAFSVYYVKVQDSEWWGVIHLSASLCGPWGLFLSFRVKESQNGIG